MRDFWQFRSTEPLGPFAVGVRVVENYDSSRPRQVFAKPWGSRDGGSSARPLQTLIWYPAERVGAPPMRVEDYARLLTNEMLMGRPRVSKLMSEWFRGLGLRLRDQLVAVREAPRVAGRFPVVVYAPGFSNPSWDNADLCEQLATHGYVVIASPSMGANTRRMTYDLGGIEAQARDISFLVGFAGQLPNADTSKVCAAGFSWGGIANLFAAARDDRIRALITLDGSHRYSPGFIRRTPDVNFNRISVPLLSIAQGRWSCDDHSGELSEEERNGPDVVGTWRGDTVSVLLSTMTHADFSSMFQRNEELQQAILEPWHRRYGDESRETAVYGYACMVRYCRRFLDTFIKDARGSSSLIHPNQDLHEIGTIGLQVTFRPQLAPTSSLARFRDCVAAGPYQNIPSIHAAFVENDPEFQLSDEALEEWCDELLNDSRYEEAVHIAQFGRELRPHSSRAHLLLGYVYERIGAHPLALESYTETLKRDPENVEAAVKKRELGR